MKAFLKWVTSAGKFLWGQTAAFVALALIIIALIIGYRIGSPAPVEDDETTASATSEDDDSEPQLYTCSMHPDVRLPDPDAKCPICFMDLIPVKKDAAGTGPNQLVLSEEAARNSAVETAKVGRFFPIAEVRIYGKLTYDETSIARITSYFPGRIERLFVNYIGVPVNKGDHLAEMYSPQLLAAFEELLQSRISVDTTTSSSKIVRISTLATLEASREKLRLFGLTDEQIKEVEIGEASRDRLTVYSPITGVVTHLSTREGAYVQTGSPIATVADLSRLWLDMEAYESQLPKLRWGQPVTFTVEAHPGKQFSGQISFIEPIVDERTRTAAVRVAIDNTDGSLKPGMFATAVVRTRVAANGAVVSDELAGHWVGPMHPTVVKEQPGQCDICGMDLVTAESLGVVGDSSKVEEPLVIPRSAALLTGTRAIVYLKVPNTEQPTYEAHEVTLGPRAGDFYIVESGLKAGDEVVVNGAFRIDSAMQIAAKPSMMMPGGGGGGSGHSHSGQGASDLYIQKRVTVPKLFIYSLKPVYAAYLDAQEALAADDLGRFILAVSDLDTALNLVDEVGVVGEPLGEWRRAASRLRVDRTVTTLDDARNYFQLMTGAIFSLQRRFGHYGQETWQVMYCSMAFDDSGGFWFQRGTTVSNPYFGESMLRCGETREAYAPLDDSSSESSIAMPANQTHEGNDHE